MRLILKTELRFEVLPTCHSRDGNVPTLYCSTGHSTSWTIVPIAPLTYLWINRPWWIIQALLFMKWLFELKIFSYRNAVISHEKNDDCQLCYYEKMSMLNEDINCRPCGVDVHNSVISTHLHTRLSNLHLLQECLSWFPNHHIHSCFFFSSGKPDLLLQGETHFLVDLNVDIVRTLEVAGLTSSISLSQVSH